MQCATCQFDNRDGRKFCAACGAPLPTPCPDCGYANEAADRYCGGCGRRLDAAAPSSPLPGGAALEGDRRPVTILFCDLVGYTRLSSERDPEEVHALLERFFALVDSIVDRFGGAIDKHIGDAAMALFGAPRAHGDDALRAVRAALEIQASVAKLALDDSTPLAVHVGVAAGEVVASSVGSDRHRRYTVTGEAANIAARLLDRASSGETLVSEAVYRATSGAATYHSLGALALKGLDRPVPVWRLTGAKSNDADAPPLAGRRSELAQCRAALGACVDCAAGAVILIRGEPGIGKTRLVEEVQSVAKTLGMSRHAGVVLDFGTERGHGAVRTIVASLLGLDPGASPELVEAAISAAVIAARITEDDKASLRDLLETPQPESARALYEAMDAATRAHGKERVLAGLVESSAAGQPVLMTIEDIHWADAQTLSLVAAIARATAESRAALIMTTRIEGDPANAGWRASAEDATLITIDLSPLSLSDALSLASRFVDSEAFVTQCVERAGGNPLFLEQLLRTAGDLSDGQLPSSIQSVVLARTDLLANHDRRAIQTASVLGQRFALPQLRALMNDPHFSCEPLLRNALLRPTKDGLQFAHALVRDGIYASLTHARRRELHRAAADVFKGDPVLRAEHLDRAGDPEAPRAYLTAAKELAGLYRHDHAIASAVRGLAIATQSRDVVALATYLGDLQQDAGRGTEALSAYRRALEASEGRADRRRALIGCAAANRLTAKIGDAFAVLAEAQSLAEPGADDRALAEIHYLRGNLHFARGELAACRSEHENALAAGRRIDSPEWQARALSGLADAQYMDCRMKTALRHFSDCVDLCDRHGLARIAVPNRVMMGHCRSYMCEFDSALEDMRKALEMAERIGNRHAEMFATQSLAFVLTGAGRYEDADPLQEKALRQVRALQARRYEAIILAQGAEIALFRAQRAEALALARQALAASTDSGLGFVGPIVYGLLSLAEDGDEAQRAALKAGEDLLGQGSVGHNHFWFRRYAIERELGSRNWREAERHADALLKRMASGPLVYASLVARRGLALARIGRGDAAANEVEDLNRTRSASDAVDFRIDALGEALSSGR